MNEKTRKAIETHISGIISDFRFDKRKLEHPDECPCYQQNKPCHNMDGKELNCFLCYCPEYDTSNPEGGCKIAGEGNGEWFYHSAHQTGRIWDCTNCDYPNREEIARKYLKAIFGLDE